jgi:hypothetical protein
VDNNESENVNENEIGEENNTNQEENNGEISEADIEDKDQIEAAEKDGEPEINENEEENNSVISNSDDAGKIYTVYANRGEGITHLARRALNERIFTRN